MQAILLAGGFGTRIQPLTNSLPKPMIPVAGKPMMEHIVNKLRSSGIHEIIMLLYYMPEVIQGHFGNGDDFGVSIKYVVPDDDYGTAGAVKFCEEHISETFMVISGDLVTDFDLSIITNAHERSGDLVTITLTSVPNPLQFGVVVTDENHKIIRFLEKPGWGEVFSDTINTGIYIFEPEIFSYIPEKANFDFSKDLFPLLLKQHIPIHGFNARGYWRDVGNPDSYREALQEFAAGDYALDLGFEPLQTPSARIWAATDANYEQGFFEGNVVIGSGSAIGNYAKLTNCIIGNHCTIGAGAELENCILWDYCVVGEESMLKDVAMCNRITIGNQVQIMHGAIIAENVTIGDRVEVEKDITIWPDKHIEEGAIVSSNIIWGDKFKASLFEGGMIKGFTNIQISVDFAAKLGAAYASFLPKNSTIIMSRDYHKASRMIKRAFLGGILSAGVNVTDIRLSPIPITRYKLENNQDLIGGAHFRQSNDNIEETVIVFYDAKGNIIDTSAEKAIERLYFREKFRKAGHDEVGDIMEQPQQFGSYIDSFISKVKCKVIAGAKFKIVLDLSFGSTIRVFPEILQRLGCETIVLNAYENASGLSRSATQMEEAIRDVQAIVRSTSADMGFILFPNGEKFFMIDNQGEVKSEDKLMMFIVKLLFLSVKGNGGKKQVYLPVSAPTVLDNEVSSYVQIVRGKFVGLQSSNLTGIDLIAYHYGLFAFREFSSAFDAMFTVAKILEMLALVGQNVSEVYAHIPPYAFAHEQINCPVEMKGMVMRRMSEAAISMEANFTDGIKIFLQGGGTIHMIPDQHNPAVHLYCEHATDEGCRAILNDYKQKISGWLSEAS